MKLITDSNLLTRDFREAEANLLSLSTNPLIDSVLFVGRRGEPDLVLRRMSPA